MLTALFVVGCQDECSGDASATISALVPVGAEVHCTDAESFEVENRSVRFTHVKYGKQLDCPSGCFSSHVCAIEDSRLASPALLHAHWTSLEEQPIGLAEACPQSFSNTSNCVTPGRSHPLVGTQDFLEFAREEKGQGPFRWCFP